MSPMHGPEPECAWDDCIPTCHAQDSCLLLLEPDGCRTCALTYAPLDEDGDPLPPDPLGSVHEPIP
jgi:hypothetical protein